MKTIIISGPPASGKTHIAETFAALYNWVDILHTTGHSTTPLECSRLTTERIMNNKCVVIDDCSTVQIKDLYDHFSKYQNSVLFIYITQAVVDSDILEGAPFRHIKTNAIGEGMPKPVERAFVHGEIDDFIRNWIQDQEITEDPFPIGEEQLITLVQNCVKSVDKRFYPWKP